MQRIITELTYRIFLICISIIVTFFVGYYYKHFFLFFFVNPYKSFTSYFIYTNIYEVFSTAFFICGHITIASCSLHSLYHTFIFFIPTLPKKQYIKTYKTYVTLNTIYLITIITTYNVVFPLTLNFFYTFQETLTSNNLIELFFEAKITSLTNFYFELQKTIFILILALSTFAFISTKHTAGNGYYRKCFYLIIFFILTIVLYLDTILMIALFFFSIILYELYCLLMTIKKLIR